MSLREEIRDYRQPDLLIVPKSEVEGTENPDTTGDGVKHFCLYHELLLRRNESTPEDQEEFERVVYSLYVRGFAGLPRRSPTKTGEQVSKDVLIAIGFCASKLKSRHAWLILNLGNSMRMRPFKWFYPNLFPSLFKDGVPFVLLFKKDFWSSWMGKHPEVIAHMQWAADVRPHFLRILWQAVYFCVVKTEHSGLNSLNWMMASVARGKSKILDRAIRRWETRLDRSRHGGLMQSLMDELEPGHPIVRYWI